MLFRPTPFLIRFSLVALSLAFQTGTKAADTYRCASNGKVTFQDHPCDDAAPPITAPPAKTTPLERQAAQHDCEEWSQLGYLAAVARDAKQPQQSVLERYGRDGLEDGERAAIDWAYRNYTTSPELIKRLIREDCLRERLQEHRAPIFQKNPDKQPGDFTIGDRRFHAVAMHPWILDNTQSGKTSATLQFFANPPDEGKMYGACRTTDQELSREQATEQLRTVAMSSNVDLSAITEPNVAHTPYGTGVFIHTTLPLRRAPNRTNTVLKEARYVTFGLLTKDGMRCDFRVETYLLDGPAQRSAITTMQTVHRKKESN